VGGKKNAVEKSQFTDPEHRPEMLRRYREALAEAAKLAGCSEAFLQAAVAADYPAW